MPQFKTKEQLQDYAATHSSVVDYKFWQDGNAARERAKADFKTNITYNPKFSYPRIENPLLNTMLDYDPAPEQRKYNAKKKEVFDVPLHLKKTNIYEAILELEANKDSGVWSPQRCDFYASYHEANLKKLLLVESAARLNDNTLSSQENIVAREEFMALNAETFGEYEVKPFSAMMNTEMKRLETFEPGDDRASGIKAYLLRALDADSFTETEPELLDSEMLQNINETVRARYADILSVVPETDDSIIYNAQECEDIMNNALRATDLYDNGWRVEIDEEKSGPSTSAERKRIYIPATTRRTAEELKRLIVHEQEVHARRGQNGAETGELPLEKGTAGYGDVEEGLGVILECALAGNLDNASFDRARDRYILAGIALGADGTPRDARQSYEILWRLLAVRFSKDGDMSDEAITKAQNLANDHVENAFRATTQSMPGIIYTKLKVYYEGFVKNAEYFRTFDGTIDEALDAAMVGKCNHTDPDEMNNIKVMQAERAAA